jgi:hypothetical protein
MNPTIKQKWVDALRSGKYEQGQWKLTRIDDYTDIMGEGKEKFCVLGVLCDIALREGVNIGLGYERDYDANAEWTEYRVYESQWDEEYNGYQTLESGNLPEEVLQWAGLPEGNPVVVYDEAIATLSQLNDVLDLPFSTLATLIDDQL